MIGVYHMGMEPFRRGPIAGVVWKPLRKFSDERGWLCELFRADELPPGFQPAMCYLSESLPGVWRGPHEHRAQTDCFCFLGPSMFELRLWDNRPGSATYWCFESACVGVDHPMAVIVPPGIVHAYRNVGATPGWVVNCPDRLYRGVGRAQEVDEIRHEEDAHSPFRVENVPEG
jgi:dTDP-4-dehydrorhamnose 3,5-epimerase